MQVTPERVHPAPLLATCFLLLVVLCLLPLSGCAGAPTATPSAIALTQTTTPTVTPPPTATATQTSTPTPTVTPTPTLTPTPTPLPGVSLIAFETTRDGNAEIYLLDTGSGELTNLTRHPAEDRDPAWRPDGGALAFESHRDGNWEIYLLDLTSGALTRLTNNPAYDGAPAWSPDGTHIAFESYRDGNLEIYVMPAAGGQPRRLTEDKAGDYGPAWSPGGQSIAFTSWRDGNKEIYLMPAAGGNAVNLTQNAADDESPAWSPAPHEGGTGGESLAFVSWRDVDVKTGNRNAEIYQMPAVGPLTEGQGISAGTPERLTGSPWPDLDPAWDAKGRLVWAAYDPGPPFETYDPYRPGDYRLYHQAEDKPVRLTETGLDDRHPAPAPAQVVSFERLLAQLPPAPQTPTPSPTLAPDTLAQVVEMPSILAADQPILVNELVSPSLVAWQQALIDASGYDLLHQTLGSWRNIDQVRRKAMYAYDYGYLSWHKTGRALDLPLEYKVDGVDQMLLAREDFGGIVTWRMYLRSARQDGSQGEPLKDNPWRYWWHIVQAEEPKAYDAGGKRLPIPAGYYVDVTEIAKRHGWERIAAYAIEGDYHWNTDSNGTEYWHYERTDDLIWWDAMRQIYSPEKLDQYVGWKAALDRAQSHEMMLSKGIPTPQP